MEKLRKNRVLYWTIEAVLVALFIYLILSVDFIFKPIGVFLGTIFVPILMAGFFFFLLKPVVNLLENRFKWHHVLAVTVTFVGFLAVFAAAISYLIPRLVTQITNMSAQLPAATAELKVQVDNILGSKWVKGLNIDYSANQFQSDFISTIQKYLSTILKNIQSVFGVATSVLVNMVTIPVMLFYFLLDGDKLVPFISKNFFPNHNKEVSDLTTKLNRTISRYIGGQFIEAVFVGTFVTIGYSIIHQPYALILGVFAGIANFIPYIGPIIGIIPAIIVALTVSTQQVIAVIIVVVIVSQIDGNLLYPNIIGRNLKIHPLTIIILLLTAGNIFGIPGMILSIPTYAVLRTVVLFIVDLYRLRKEKPEKEKRKKELKKS